MAIPAINVLGNPNVTEGNFQIAIEDLRKSVIGSGKVYDSANTYSQYDTCVSGGIVYYSKINSNTGNTPSVGANWGLIGDLITGVVHNVGNESIDGIKTFSTSPIVPTPTTGTQAVNKDYADLKVALTDFTGANQSLGTSGYQKLPGGLILQWGSYSNSTSVAASSFNFPIAFPNAVFSVTVNLKNQSGGAFPREIFINQTSNKTSCDFSLPDMTSGGAYDFNYIAIGY